MSQACFNIRESDKSILETAVLILRHFAGFLDGEKVPNHLEWIKALSPEDRVCFTTELSNDLGMAIVSNYITEDGPNWQRVRETVNGWAIPTHIVSNPEVASRFKAINKQKIVPLQQAIEELKVRD